jgi:hypothetical protein
MKNIIHTCYEGCLVSNYTWEPFFWFGGCFLQISLKFMQRFSNSEEDSLMMAPIQNMINPQPWLLMLEWKRCTVVAQFETQPHITFAIITQWVWRHYQASNCTPLVTTWQVAIKRIQPEHTVVKTLSVRIKASKQKNRLPTQSYTRYCLYLPFRSVTPFRNMMRDGDGAQHARTWLCLNRHHAGTGACIIWYDTYAHRNRLSFKQRMNEFITALLLYFCSRFQTTQNS